MINLARFVMTLLILFIFWRVASNTVDPSGPEIDPRLASLVAEWKSDMEKAGIDYETGFNRIDKISIIDLADDRVGVSNKRTREVLVDPIQFDKGDYSVRATLYHELGHYVFGLEHGDCLLLMEYELEEKDYQKGWSTLKKSYLVICKENEFESKY